MRFPILIFDLDGTLVNSTADLAAAVNAARAACGHAPLPVEKVRTSVGDGLRVLLTRCLPAQDVERGVAPFRDHYAAHLLDQTAAYPGVHETLAHLAAAGCRMGVVTNKPREFAVRILDALGLSRHLPIVLGGDAPEGLKPAPQPFLAVRAKLAGHGHPTLVVGDGRNDVLGARAAGLPVCGALYGMGDPHELRALSPDHLINEPRELLSVVAVPAPQPEHPTPRSRPA